VLWIPITIAASALQTLRNALQRQLTGKLSALGATYIRFLFGLPFAALYLALLAAIGVELNPPTFRFIAFCFIAAVSQIGGMLALIILFQLRNFTVGVAYSKTEIVQLALVSVFIVGESIPVLGWIAIFISTFGVMLLSVEKEQHPIRALFSGWTQRPALLGLASGAGYAIAATTFREATRGLEPSSLLGGAAETVVVVLALQTIILGAFIRWREPDQLGVVLRSWRQSSLPGLAGAAATSCWILAFALQTPAYVRMLGMLEVVFSYWTTLFVMRERHLAIEIAAISLLIGGILLLLGATV
jgi:drug/metabolite transporter (DMT)-like permease